MKQAVPAPRCVPGVAGWEHRGLAELCGVAGVRRQRWLFWRWQKDVSATAAGAQGPSLLAAWCLHWISASSYQLKLIWSLRSFRQRPVFKNGPCSHDLSCLVGMESQRCTPAPNQLCRAEVKMGHSFAWPLDLGLIISVLRAQNETFITLEESKFPPSHNF